MLSANGYYYKVTNQRTIIVIPDQPAKHQQYDDLVIKVFFISHADATELSQTLAHHHAHPADGGAADDDAEQDREHDHRPRDRAGGRHHRAADPRQRQAARRSGARHRDPRSEPRARSSATASTWRSYALGLLFSPELAPPNTVVRRRRRRNPPPFNLNTIIAGRQHGRLLPGRAVGAGELPRERLAHQDAGEAAAARPGRAGAHAQPGLAGADSADDLRPGGRRRVRDHPAVVVQLQARSA